MQPWWCGYPGCKVTGECGHYAPGPCEEEKEVLQSDDYVTLWYCDGRAFGCTEPPNILPIINEHILSQPADWDDLSTIRCWGAVKVGGLMDTLEKADQHERQKENGS